jgi:hypothetical protein
LSLALASIVTVPDAHAQDDNSRYDEPSEAHSGLGGQILLTNSGFGLGGYFTRLIARDLTFIAEISLGNTKDEREVAFFDRFGRKDLPNKANYLLSMPVQVGIEKRLFRTVIEDNFRPFVHLSAGPTVGWKYPYYRDSNGNGTLDEGEKTYDVIGSLPRGSFAMGFGGSVAVGAYFGETRGMSQSVRIGYSFTHYFDAVELLERSIREPAHFFGSPTILVSFGKLF